MSDDLENVSVVETTAEQSVVGAEPVEPPTEELPAETSSEPVHDDERVFTPSTRIGNAEDYNRQQVAEENGMALGNGGVDGRTVTQTGHAAKAEAAKDKQSDLIEHLEQSERRKDWLERDHDFGGMRMSGHDLAKMIDFISNPHMQDKLRERLGKSGVPKEKVDKGMKELNEYIDLKKKEQDGGKLSEEQHLRLKELEKSETLKVVQREAAQLAVDNGVKLSAQNANDLVISRTAVASPDIANAKVSFGKSVGESDPTKISKLTDNSAVSLGGLDDTPQKPEPFVAASARNDFPKTVHLTETFTDTNSRQVAAAANTTQSLTDENEPVALIASANTNLAPTQKTQPSTVMASL